MSEAPSSAGARSYIHMTSRDGHKQAYIDLFGPMFGLEPSVGRIGPAEAKRLVSAQRLFFGTLDDDVVGFTLIALLRSLLGRRSAGLFLHPNSCFGGGAKAKIKWLLFAFLSRLPRTKIISILPEQLLPRVGQIATSDSHDPQFWDQLENPPVADDSIVAEIHEHARGRVTLAYIGGLTFAKAFPRLMKLFTMSPELRDRVQLVVAGHCYDDCHAEVAALREVGVLIWNRFVSDEEIVALYTASDWVWTSYAPGYDQASGIFGRSVQWKKAVVVREDSTVLAAYVRLLDHPALLLSNDDAEAVRQLTNLGRPSVAGVDGSSFERSAETCRKWKLEFQDMVRFAIG